MKEALSKPVSVVIPAYNEEVGVSAQVESVRRVLNANGIAHEILVVDDGSEDRTAEQALQAQARVLRHPANRGYGAAIKTGIMAAKYDTIAITDADGTYPCEEIPRLIAELDTADMAVGARIGENVNIPLLRRPAKAFLRWLAARIAGEAIPDLNSGLRVFRRECIRQYFSILSDRFSFTTTSTLAFIADGYVGGLPSDQLLSQAWGVQNSTPPLYGFCHFGAEDGNAISTIEGVYAVVLYLRSHGRTQSHLRHRQCFPPRREIRLVLPIPAGAIHIVHLALTSGIAVVTYRDGGRWRGQTHRPAQQAARAVARDTRVSIVPVASGRKASWPDLSFQRVDGDGWLETDSGGRPHFSQIIVGTLAGEGSWTAQPEHALSNASQHVCQSGESGGVCLSDRTDSFPGSVSYF